MSEQMHPVKAVRVQSSAVVLAAIITTGGAVMSAFIQTSTGTKPPLMPIEMSTPTEPISVAQSAMPQLGAYQANSKFSFNADAPSPVAINSSALDAVGLNTEALEPNLASAQAASNLPAKLTSAQPIAFHAPAAAYEKSHENLPEKERFSWNVSKPMLPNGSVAKPIISPWYCISHSETVAAPKTAKKFDWGSVTKLFQWHN